MSGLEPIPPGLLADLGDARAYPDDPGAQRSVTHVQTHISDVFLTPGRVYKLRKAVDLGFVCFATRAERNADCLRELTLNRRLAPDVYLGVAPVFRTGGGYRIGTLSAGIEPGEADREHCVVMRRLPDGRDALSLLGRGELRKRHVDAVAEQVAHFHETHRLTREAHGAPQEWLARCTEPVRANLEALTPVAGARLVPATLERLRRRSTAFEAAEAERFEARRRAGRGVDGHGDLHLEHVWFERDDSAPLLIDCLEFRDDLRCIDAASDVAFLAMDLDYRKRPRLAARFLRRYARSTDDFDLYSVVDYFLSYRAAVRAKVAAIVAHDATLPAARREAAAGSARRHLRLAARALERPAPPCVAAMCGVVGTGKSSAAELVADALGEAAVIASDRVRKRIAARSPGPDSELYTDASKERVYQGLLERAAPIAASGRVAVLDATFSKRSRRARVLDFARQRSIPALLVETRCPQAEALSRLRRRQARGLDPSDAGPSYYAASVAELEAPDEWPASDRIVVDTSERGWRGALRDALRSWRRASLA
ncbi:MAG: AAA family ATPase [Deltaproteobacteria bacterium]|nr:MAG: AAA family ATPase [Deltaproteobacteria bacterium]